MSKSKKLGRGLGALLGDDLTAERTEELKISLIVPNEYQPRHAFDEESLGELANSIREHGVYSRFWCGAKITSMNLSPGNAASGRPKWRG